MQDNQPGLLVAIWRFRWLVVVTTATVVAVAIIFHLLRPQEEVYEAVSTIVVQEVSASAEGTVSQGGSSQFIRTQIEVMRSPVVLEAAAALLLSQQLEDAAIEVGQNVSVLGSVESPLVTIVARGSSEVEAIATANAVADAYREVSQRQLRATTDAQLARIDAQVAAINERLGEIAIELLDLVASDEHLHALQMAAVDAVEQIAVLQVQLTRASGEEAGAIRQKIQDYRQAIILFQEVQAVSSASSERQALLEEQSRQVDRRARLLIRRDEISVDAELAPDTVALVQPALTAELLSGLGLARLLAVALILGVGAGVGMAYLLSTWRRSFSARGEPEAVLNAPLVSDIPDFDDEGIASRVPVRDNPRSAVAEGFRFAAATTATSMRNLEAKSLLVVSAIVGHGKTTTVLNMGAAMAGQGSSVLLLDCDFGNQELSRLLAGAGSISHPGITDYVDGFHALEDIIQSHRISDGISLSLVSRGTRPKPAATSLSGVAIRHLFDEVTDQFDVVLVDGPPLLQVAYASTLAELTDAVLVVVEHESRYSDLVDLRRRLDLIGSPVVGYVYNRSPLRREMTMTDGSMTDILGDAGLSMARGPQRRADG